MSDEDAIRAAIDQRPDDSLPRFVLADWLEERAGTESCPKCERLDGTNRGWNLTTWLPYKEEVCMTCSGTGHVPDRTARLAVGYRALGEYGRVPHPDEDSKTGKFCWFTQDEDYWKPSGNVEVIPNPWYSKLTEETYEERGCWKGWGTRRTAEDAAALAWADLTDDERVACDRELRAKEAVTR